MKKKLVFALFTVLIAAALVCCACVPKGESQDILELCDSISDAKNATQVISVKNGGGELLAQETRSYNFATGKVEITRTTLNSSDADELYTTETESKDITGKPTVKLTRDLLTIVAETDTTLKATVSNSNLNEMFGIDSSNVAGNANVEISAQGEHILSITVSYTSSSGNAVQIATTYVY